ncbi:hypothetical protein AAHH87_00625 [Candidatus Hodgkinia cicadicola]
MLQRPKLGSKSSRKLRSAGFVPGFLKTLSSQTVAITVASKLLRKLSYKQTALAKIGNKLVPVKLVRYQLDPITSEFQHIEYQQCNRLLASTPARVLVFNATSCAAVKSGGKFKALQTKTNLVGDSEITPNYVKLDVSEYSKGDVIKLAHLRCKHIQFASCSLNNVLAAVS